MLMRRCAAIATSSGGGGDSGRAGAPSSMLDAAEGRDLTVRFDSTGGSVGGGGMLGGGGTAMTGGPARPSVAASSASV